MRELESCRREIDEIDAELVRLFERCGSQRLALLLCHFKRLAPELFVLPFDPARVLGSDDKVAALLAKPTLTSKAFTAFADLVALQQDHHNNSQQQQQQAPIDNEAPQQAVADATTSTSTTKAPRDQDKGHLCLFGCMVRSGGRASQVLLCAAGVDGRALALHLHKVCEQRFVVGCITLCASSWCCCCLSLWWCW